MKTVVIALLAIGVATPAFAQFQQLRQLGTVPNPNALGADPYYRNDGNYTQPPQRPSNGYPADSYNALGQANPGRTIYLTTPNSSRY